MSSPPPSAETPIEAGDTPSRQARKPLGEILLQTGWISEEDVKEALIESRKTGQYLGSVLIRQGKITREQLGKALAEQFNSQYISLGSLEIDKGLLKLLPEEFIRDNQVLPIAMEGGRLVVAMVDPRNRQVYDEITFITGMRPKAMVTTSFEFFEALNKLSLQGNIGVLDKLNAMSTGQDAKKANDIQSREQSSTGESNSGKSGQDKGSAEALMRLVNSVTTEETRENVMRQQQLAEMFDTSNPLVKLVNSIIEEGIEKNASDIHIESRERACTVRFRVDGILRTILEIPPNMESTFMTRIKVMARMDIAEHRRPQDGRISLTYKATEYNLRVNTLPIGEGREKIVIRILRPSKNIKDFADLGISPSDIKKIETLYKSPYGIVLVCGPTGSGKTTTLYTVLHKINEETLNISTVEDPIELKIEGLNQSQVNHKADYSFALALRALLRQDPDVIMIGEIRDYETLESAIHASLTGHLVFSTIHANTTAATVTRLVEMGADTSLVCASVLGVIAQRLARSLCDECKEAYAASEEERELIFAKFPEKQKEPLKLYRAKGCSACTGGYKGRAGLYEIMMMDRNIRQLVAERKLDTEIEDASVASGMTTLHMSAVDLLIKGKSSIDEIVRILGPTLGRTV